MFTLYMKVVNSSQSVGFTKCRIIPAIYWMTPVLYTFSYFCSKIKIVGSNVYLQSMFLEIVLRKKNFHMTLIMYVFIHILFMQKQCIFL